MFKCEKVAEMRRESVTEIGQTERIERMQEARSEIDQREQQQ